MNHPHALAALLLAAVFLAPAAGAGAGACDYRVSVEPGPPMALLVDGRCDGVNADDLRFVHRPAAPFAVVEPLLGDERIRYRFDVDGFVASAGNYRVATRRGDARMLTLASWLAVPAAARPDTRINLWVDASTSRFASALARDGQRLSVDAGDLRRSGYTVFGGSRSRSIRVPAPDEDGESIIEVVDMRGRGDDLLPWIEDTADQVARFFGRFPVRRLLLVLLETDGDGIDYGRVVSGGGATMLLVIGESSSREALYGEWVLVHEMLHLGSPFMGDGYWFMEGFATYAEPIIRARAGWRSERSVWNEFYRDMPRGVPALTEQGLARTRSGMYWGGALFMLLADREYRRLSNGGQGLEHCMRGVMETLGNNTRRASVSRVMRFCDAHFDAPVMADLARRYVTGASPFDIGALWHALGISGPRGDARFANAAPEAGIRKAIVRRSAGGHVEMDEGAPDMDR